MGATTYSACPVIRSEVKHFLKFRSGYPLRTLPVGRCLLGAKRGFWLVSCSLKGALLLTQTRPAQSAIRFAQL